MIHKNIKKVIVIGVLAVVATSYVIAANLPKKESVVVLNSQKQEIENHVSPLLVQEINDFTGEVWIDENRLVGILEKDEHSSVAMYDMQTKKLQEYDSKENTTISSLGWSPDKSKFVYYSIDEEGVCYLRVLDFQTGKTTDIIKNGDEDLASIIAVEDNKIFFAVGCKIMECDYEGNVKTVKEFKGKELQMISDFTGTEFEEMRKEIIDDWMNNNQIVSLYKKGNEIYFSTLTSKGFKYDIEKDKLKEVSTAEATMALLGKAGKQCYDQMTSDHQNKELWLYDENGKKQKLIAKSDYMILSSTSPDHTSVFYVDYKHREWNHDTTQSKSYIYDGMNDKNIPIIEAKEIYMFDWTQDSKHLFVTVIEEKDSIVTKIFSIK